MKRFRKQGPKRAYSDRDVHLHELVDWEKPIVADAIFERCTVYGPAVLAPDSETSFRECGFAFEGSGEEVLWEVPPLSIKTGCIAVERCAFVKCEFYAVGIAGGPKIIAQFRRLIAPKP